MVSPDPEMDDPVQSLPSPDPTPDRMAMSEQAKQRIAWAMDRLSSSERQAFVLRHFEGQSIEEISGALGLSANAAKHSIFRAVQKLRRALEPLVGEAS